MSTVDRHSKMDDNLRKTRSHTLSMIRGYPLDFLSDCQSKQSLPECISCCDGLPSTFVPSFHDDKLIRKMTYRRVGNTNIFVSKISLVPVIYARKNFFFLLLGCGPIGGNYGRLESSVRKIIEVTLKSGINLIDVGYWYGQQRAEQILGKILSKYPRQSYLLSVSVGRFDLDYTRTSDYRADNILNSLTHSIKNLRLSFVDICLLQIHDSDFYSYRGILLYETLPALQVAQRSGKIRLIGLVGYSLKKLAEVTDASPVQIDIVMTYCRGTLNDNSLGEYYRFFESRNIAIINAAPLSMGLLTSSGPPKWHPAPAKIKRACNDALKYCIEKEMSLEKLALYYALNFPGICTCCVGMDSVKQVLENIKIAELERLTVTEQRLQDRLLRRQSYLYFDRLQNTSWENLDLHEYWKHLKTLSSQT
uniref:Aldo_ket_red domain-containing protein n=1 Tax=Syphacia muris TaxID=451379 RepID=A0A0N5AAD2_9BILA